jgi:hypothetical protein
MCLVLFVFGRFLAYSGVGTDLATRCCQDSNHLASSENFLYLVTVFAFLKVNLGCGVKYCHPWWKGQKGDDPDFVV